MKTATFDTAGLIIGPRGEARLNGIIMGAKFDVSLLYKGETEGGGETGDEGGGCLCRPIYVAEGYRDGDRGMPP